MGKKLKFGIIGAAGFVAQRHMAAIKAIDGELVAVCDPNDSVGILDSYFPNCRYFWDSHLFFEYCQDSEVNYIAICTPNYLHFPHCLATISRNINAIIEKPVFINSHNIDQVHKDTADTNISVWPILQCRMHPAVISWKNRNIGFTKHQVVVEYVTPRGRWYDDSWKGDPRQSGGLAFNIGIHLFDLCCYLFGRVISSRGMVAAHNASGVLDMEFARVEWFLSIKQGPQRKRLFTIDGDHIDLTNGFEDLHTEAYKRIIEGRSWGLGQAKPAIEICEGLIAN